MLNISNPCKKYVHIVRLDFLKIDLTLQFFLNFQAHVLYKSTTFIKNAYHFFINTLLLSSKRDMCHLRIQKQIFKCFCFILVADYIYAQNDSQNTFCNLVIFCDFNYNNANFYFYMIICNKPLQNLI